MKEGDRGGMVEGRRRQESIVEVCSSPLTLRLKEKPEQRNVLLSNYKSTSLNTHTTDLAFMPTRVNNQCS